VPLLALDAQLELTGPAGARSLPLAAFLLGNRRTALAPGEIATALLLPHPPAGAKGGFLKLGARRYLVISIAMIVCVSPAATVAVAAAACVTSVRAMQNAESVTLCAGRSSPYASGSF
jgi:N-methylhydantoinase B